MLDTISTGKHIVFLSPKDAFVAIKGPRNCLDEETIIGVIMFHFTYGSVYTEDWISILQLFPFPPA